MEPRQIATLIATVPIPLVLIGGDERVIAMNPPAEGLFGKSWQGRHYVTALRHPALLDCVEAARSDARARTAMYLTRQAERDVTWRATVDVLGDTRGAVMLALEDISQVQAADEMRRDFVANVSHELRTPLTAMLGFIETLQGPARDDLAARDRFLGIMQTEAARMSRLIEDLLSLSRVEASERLLPAARVDIAGIARDAVSMLQGLADETGVLLKVSGLKAQFMVRGDRDQLTQVMTNLIENAVKYGGRTVSVRLAPQDRDLDLRGPAVRVEVSDDGPGIDPLHIPRLTERFYRIDTHRSREKAGTGLGLAIVKHIVNRHRGRLRIESAPGKGSRFAVVLPASEDDASIPGSGFPDVPV